MNPDTKSRAILVALLLATWAGLIAAKAYAPASVLPDVGQLTFYIQSLLAGIVGYHVGASPSADTKGPTS